MNRQEFSRTLERYGGNREACGEYAEISEQRAKKYNDVAEKFRTELLAEFDRLTATVEEVDIVFDGPPEAQAGRFIEVEDNAGKSIKYGEWVHRQDGFWVLRITRKK